MTEPEIQETNSPNENNDNNKNNKGQTSKSQKVKKVVISDADLPEKLSAYITDEIWRSWSPIRRESFKQIIKNPNSFFYRNRPPGDPQKRGGFSEEEEKQFLDRLEYFKTLGVEDGFWGLFSVPILGRVGYQCSNFYRALIKEGKIVDSHYQIDDEGKLKYSHGKRSVDPKVIEVLEKEAFEFIDRCLRPEDGKIPQINSDTVAINVESNVVKRPKIPKENNPIFVSIEKSPYAVFDGFGRPRTLGDRISQRSSLSDFKFNLGAKTGSSRIKKNKSKEIIGLDGNHSPYFGAPDPLTGNPIMKPMADSNCFVMDLQSWRMVFCKDAKPPVQTPALDEDDLTEINMENFDTFKLMVRNIVC